MAKSFQDLVDKTGNEKTKQIATKRTKELLTDNESVDIQDRFINIAQTLFISWIKDLPNNVENNTRKENIKQFNFIAELAFDAASEFIKVFGHKENKSNDPTQ
jgi:hypothetical protein